MSVAGYRIQVLERKDNKMLLLDYTIEKEGVSLTEKNRLMVSEYQINDLLPNYLASHLFDTR